MIFLQINQYQEFKEGLLRSNKVLPKDTQSMHTTNPIIHPIKEEKELATCYGAH